MLQTRLLVGSLLIAWGCGILFVDVWFAPWFPLLYLFALGITGVLSLELTALLPRDVQPRRGLLLACTFLVITANWSRAFFAAGPVWHLIGAALTLSLLIIFVVEASHYREPGGITQRIALTYFILAYISLLSSFLVQLRWWSAISPWQPDPGNADFRAGLGTLALLLAIFIPKCCDIGAYFTGRLVGKHRMTPVLSPKKTWEGAAGGLALAGAVSLLITHGISDWLTLDRERVFPLRAAEIAGLPGWFWSLLFGVVIGLAGMIGDLMESLLKRDLRHKDAAATVPGFGGLLDVFDSILFSAPLTYSFLQILSYFTRNSA